MFFLRFSDQKEIAPEPSVEEEELGRGKRLKVPSWKVRRNLNEELEIDDTDYDADYDTEEEEVVVAGSEWKPKEKKKKRVKKDRPEYQNTLDLLWGRFRVSLVLIALAINTVCEDLGITDRSKYVSVTRLANLLKKFDENLLTTHAENNYGFPDLGKKYALKNMTSSFQGEVLV